MGQGDVSGNPPSSAGVCQGAVCDTVEHKRLVEDAARTKNWKRWGPYLAERQWGTVREDYSADGDCWNYFTHDQSRSRAYRWGEDGLLGITDRECRLCFALALWNGKDAILKERMFGLTGPEGNHGEDVKELYYYMDSTPTHSYMKGLYKYPQAAYPYQQLVEVNRGRSKQEGEFEITDTGVFEGNRYFDVMAEYAKGCANDMCIKITVSNRGPEAAPLHVLPTVWFRNSWTWGCDHDGCEPKPWAGKTEDGMIDLQHTTLGNYFLAFDPANGPVEKWFCENETNTFRLFQSPDSPAYPKDAFGDYLINHYAKVINPKQTGTKAAGVYALNIPAGGKVVLKLRLFSKEERPKALFGAAFDDVFAARKKEADEFYGAVIPAHLTSEEKNVARQAYAGLLWSKQFYHYVVEQWLDGDPNEPTPPQERKRGRNSDWRHVFCRDVLSMPDAWEYPWFAAWDMAFHMITMAHVDGQFAKDQLLLMLREWYMHPNGQIPAYEFSFSDVNPPVHAWACWRVYKMTGPRGQRDRLFLERAFQKLMINFTWWVNRKDIAGQQIFAGGFLGLDNIGIFDRSRPLPTGGHLEQADGTAWMAFYCATMLSMALELASFDAAYEDVASKFFEHFVAIVDAINTLGGTGLWDEQDGFYYDQLRREDGSVIPLRTRSMVGVIPVYACESIECEHIDKLPGFTKRMQWFMQHKKGLSQHIAFMRDNDHKNKHHYLVAIPSRKQLEAVLKYLLDEKEFLSAHGLRSLSRVYKDKPFLLNVDGRDFSVAYEPAESTTGLFGGNSNWRGPVWFPVNYLLIEALERYYHFYGDEFTVEFPTGSGNKLTLKEVSAELRRRLSSLFLADGKGGTPPFLGKGPMLDCASSPEALVQFHEYFHGETGQGLGASHQTGWTSLVALCLAEATPRGSKGEKK